MLFSAVIAEIINGILTFGRTLRMQWINARKVYLPAAITLILTLSMTLVFCWSYYSQQYQKAINQFKMDAMVYTHAVEIELERSQQVVTDLAALFQSLPRVDRKVFAAIAEEKLKYHQGIQALEWVPRVLHAQRASYEEQARTHYPDFYFYALDVDGKRIPAPQQSEYFPVYYLQPHTGNEDAFGYTPINYSAREEAITDAIESGSAVASERVQLVQEKQEQFGLLIFAPVFNSKVLEEGFEARKEQIIGLTLGVFRVGDLIENALSHQQELPLNLAWFDLDSRPESSFLYWHNLEPLHYSEPQNFKLQDLPTFNPDFVLDNRFEKLSRHWRLMVYPKEKAYLPPVNLALSYLIIGCVLSFLFAVIIYRWRRLILINEQNLSTTITETRSKLDNKEQTLRRQNTALTHLACNLRSQITTLDQSLEHILEVTAETMQVERVSAWFLAKENRLIRCQSLFERSKSEFSKGQELQQKNYPKYFSAILSSDAIVACDANSDSRTCEFSDDYLQPLGIGAMLDIPLRHQGKIVGVICLEHVGDIRDWSTEEIHFATSIANFISLAVESIRRQQAEQELRQTSERLSLINSLTNSMRAGMSIKDVIECTLQRLFEEFPNYRVSYSTISENGIIEVCRCITPVGMPDIEGVVVNLKQVPDYFKLLRRHEAAIINDVSTDQRVSQLSDTLMAGKSVAILDMPLKDYDNLIGLLCFDAPFLHHWLDHEIATLRDVAEFLELAMRDARGQEEKRKAEQALAIQKNNLKKLVKVRTAELERRAQLELIVANFSTEFINLAAEQFTISIQRVLKTIGEFYHAECCSFVEVLSDEKSLANHQYSVVHGVEPFFKQHANSVLEQFPWIHSQLKRNQLVYLRDIDELSQAASVDKSALESSKVKSLVIIPLIYGLKLAGIFQLSTQNYCLICKPDDLVLFQLVGNMLMNAAERNRYEKELKRSEKLLQKSNKKLQTLATVDSLTGIANRRLFDEKLQSEFRRAQREQYPLSIIFFDIDFFKQFNDEFGHIAGDLCLKRVAATLQAHCQRATELVARYGGEEFVIILSNASAEHALTIAERIRQSILSLAITAASQADSHFLTLSGGIASWTPGLENTPQELLQAADSALYQAKAEGRNCVKLASAQNVVNLKIK